MRSLVILLLILLIFPFEVLLILGTFLLYLVCMDGEILTFKLIDKL